MSAVSSTMTFATFPAITTASASASAPGQLVIFGSSNILSDLFDCALANGLTIKKVVLHLAEQCGERDLPLVERVAMLHRLGQTTQIQTFEQFEPEPNELYLLGPTTPSRAQLVQALAERFQAAQCALSFVTLVHPTAYVSPLAQLSQGVFVGANSVIGPGVQLAEHVFVQSWGNDWPRYPDRGLFPDSARQQFGWPVAHRARRDGGHWRDRDRAAGDWRPSLYWCRGGGDWRC